MATQAATQAAPTKIDPDSALAIRQQALRLFLRALFNEHSRWLPSELIAEVEGAKFDWYFWLIPGSGRCSGMLEFVHEPDPWRAGNMILMYSLADDAN